jgi:hypothetical protein
MQQYSVCKRREGRLWLDEEVADRAAGMQVQSYEAIV